jgi:membrane protein involved in colicin uptake
MSNSNNTEQLEKSKKRNTLIAGVVVVALLSIMALALIWGILKGRGEEPEKVVTTEEEIRIGDTTIETEEPISAEEEKIAAPEKEKPPVKRLSKIELAAKRKAEEEARKKEQARARKQAEEEARRLAKAEDLRKAELEAVKRSKAEAKKKTELEARKKAEAKKKAELEARKKAEAEAKKKAELEARKKTEAEAKKKTELEARKKAEAKKKTELEARKKAEAEAKKKTELEARKKAEAEAKKKAELEARKKAEAEAKKKAEEEARKKAEAEAKKKAEEEARKKAEAEAKKKAEEEALAKAKTEKKTEPEQKVFQPEDLSIPATPKVSEDARLAMVQPMKKPVSGNALANASMDFKLGMDAYEAKDYRNAVKSFSKIPKPPSKKRGPPEREEYVKATFYKGLALQKQGGLKDAITAYKTVLQYERYFPVCHMNLGICYVELRQYAKADRSFRNVIRDQNRAPPNQYDDVMQRTRYFWALAWTRLYKAASQPDKKAYFKRQARLKWSDYQAWFGKNGKYSKANSKADDYIRSLGKK